MPGGQELKLGDVEAARAQADLTSAKPRPPTAPKSPQRLGPGNAIHREPLVPLE
jgi:hypothetical protein